MSKDKRVTDFTEQLQGAMKSAIVPPVDQPEVLADATGIGSMAEVPKKRRSMSTPLQVMAKIEQLMEPLPLPHKEMVAHWFQQAYCLPYETP